MSTISPISEEQRLKNANEYFRCKRIAVYNDKNAVALLYEFYNKKLQEITDFNFKINGLSLAKLTAANIFEISANSIYITEPGMAIIYRLKSGDMEMRPHPYAINHQLDMINNWFKRKAAEVFIYDNALILLDELYQKISIQKFDFDYKNNSIALSKLTGASFCNIGKHNIFLSESGYKFVNNLIDHKP